MKKTDDGYTKQIKCLSALYRGVTSNHDGDFRCLGCLHSHRTDNALKKHERLCSKHDYCDTRIPSGGKNILRCNFGEKSLKVSALMYLDFEYLLVKQQSCQNNPEKSYTEGKAMSEPCGYSLRLLRSYEKNIRSFCKGTDCTKKLCEELKEFSFHFGFL